MQAREYAIELARKRYVTTKDALEILAMHMSVGELTRSEMRRLDRVKAGLGIEEKLSASEPSLAERAWSALESLLDTFDTLHILRLDDTEPYPDEHVPASVTCLGGDAISSRPWNAMGHQLIDAVLRLAGRESTGGVGTILIPIPSTGALTMTEITPSKICPLLPASNSRAARRRADRVAEVDETSDDIGRRPFVIEPG